MKSLSGLVAFLFAIYLVAASAFIAIAITTGQSLRFWDDAVTDNPVVTSTEASGENTNDKSVEINFVFCSKPEEGVELNADTCSPLSIRGDSKVYIQLAGGDPIVIDGFNTVKTGFKIKIDSGDTVVAISIENRYFDAITFGESTLELEQVSVPKTVYLPL